MGRWLTRRDLGLLLFEDNSNDAQLVGKIGLILDDKQARATFYVCLL
jgi:hypothetical protein